MEMYKYKIYSFVLKTRIKFEMLSESDCYQDNEELNLYVNEKNPENPEYVLTFEEDIVYYFYPTNNSIYVCTSNIEYLYNSFFNIPMSIYLLFKGKALIHCNGLVFKENLYCFSGKKGIGKTTLTLQLMKTGEFFSDDCVAFELKNNAVYGYNATNVMKICEDTFNYFFKDFHFLDYYNIFFKKSTKKFYYVFTF